MNKPIVDMVQSADGSYEANPELDPYGEYIHKRADDQEEQPFTPRVEDRAAPHVSSAEDAAQNWLKFLEGMALGRKMMFEAAESVKGMIDDARKLNS